MENEEWKTIPDYPLYQASNHGRIRNKHQHVMTPILNNGYHLIGVINPLTGLPVHRRVHRLVASAWIPNPENKPQVDHINNQQKTNNHISNLRWVTAKENMRSFYDNNKKARKVGLILTRDNERLEFKTIGAAAKHFGKSLATIWGYSINGRCYGYTVERVIQNNEPVTLVVDEDNDGTHLQAE